MENSSRFFCNRDCEYYPCHRMEEELNCLFCYCPLYARENCPGNHRWIEGNGGRIKDCMDCTFPHRAENYDMVIRLLSGQNGAE